MENKVKRILGKIKEIFRHIWAWFWQTCDTCKYRSCDESCSECTSCRGGTPAWEYGLNVTSAAKTENASSASNVAAAAEVQASTTGSAETEKIEETENSQSENLPAETAESVGEANSSALQEDEISAKTAEIPPEIPIEAKNTENTEQIDGQAAVSADEWYTVTLSETDGDANKSALQEALDNHKKVVIATGVYPLTPSVTVRSGILDLGNSVITSTARKFDGGLICLEGEGPTVQNGELAGNFHEQSPSVSSDLFWEKESLVAPVTGSYTDAVVDNVRLHNCWGYAISERGNLNWSSITRIGIPDEHKNYVYKTDASRWGSTVTETSDGYECTSVDIPIDNFAGTPRCKYVYAHGGLGYYRVISDEKVKYTFKLSDGTEDISYDWQGMPVSIPSDAVSVSVTLRWKKGNTNWKSYPTYTCADGIDIRQYKGFTLRFSDYAGGLTVRNCKTYYNSSLGMTGGSVGTTLAIGCESWGNGHPEEGVSDSQTTVGFIDIEDVVTPYIELRNCTSKDELHFAMLGALHTTVDRCTADGDTLIYRGIDATVSDTDSPIGTFSLDVETPVSVKNCIIRGSVCNRLPASVYTDGCTFYNVPVRPSEYDVNGTYIYTKSTQGVMPNGTRVTGAGDITGVCDANIEIQYNTGNMWSAPSVFGVFAPEPGSDVRIACNAAGASDMLTYGLQADDNCYGVTLDDTLLPCGNIISGCTFTPGKYVHRANPKYMHGTFENCTFNLDGGAFFTTAAHMYDKKVVFRNCVIHNSKNFLFNAYGSVGIGRGNEFVFEQCMIDDVNKIAATRENTSGVATAGVPTITIIDR